CLLYCKIITYHSNMQQDTSNARLNPEPHTAVLCCKKSCGYKWCVKHSLFASKSSLCCAGLCWAVLCWAVLCCAVLCWAVLGWAVLCWAVLGCAVLCWAVLGWAGLCWARLVGKCSFAFFSVLV